MSWGQCVNLESIERMRRQRMKEKELISKERQLKEEKRIRLQRKFLERVFGIGQDE